MVVCDRCYPWAFVPTVRGRVHVHAIFGMFMYKKLANSQCIPFQKYIYMLPKCLRFDFYSTCSIVDKKGTSISIFYHVVM